MILRYPPQQQTNSSSCSSLFPSQFGDSPFQVMNSNTNTSSNFRVSFIHHHSTETENENNSLMNDEPCTPCSTWLSLTSLHQLSFNSNNNLSNTPDLSTTPPSSTTTTSCTINSNIETQLMPPPLSQTSSNTSAKDLFEEEFRIKCNKYRKVNEATRSMSSLTPCSASSTKSLDSNDKCSQDNNVEPTINNNSGNINAATASIVSKVLSNVLSKSIELKQTKIQKQRSGIKRHDVPRLVIPNDQSSPIFVKHCSLKNGKKQ